MEVFFSISGEDLLELLGCLEGAVVVLTKLSERDKDYPLAWGEPDIKLVSMILERTTRAKVIASDAFDDAA